MPITVGFNHVATLTADLDRLVGFYREAFDAEVTFEMAKAADHPRMSIVDLGGGAALNVFEVGQDEIIGEQRRQGGRGAIDHFALAVDSRSTLERCPRADRRRRRRRRRDPTTRRRMVVVLP